MSSVTAGKQGETPGNNLICLQHDKLLCQHHELLEQGDNTMVSVCMSVIQPSMVRASPCGFNKSYSIRMISTRPASATHLFFKDSAMYYHVYVTMHVKGPPSYLSFVSC